MKRFHLLRLIDVNGISGTGKVAVGVVFPSGKCVMEWLSKAPVRPSIECHDSIEDLIKIHGHNGNTKVIFED